MTISNEINYVTCRCCGNSVSLENNKSAYVREDRTISYCKVCTWIKRNNQRISSIKGYTLFQICQILKFFYNDNGVYINDFSVQEKMPLQNAINLFQLLKIANVKCLVKASCERCRKEIEYSPSAYLTSKDHYCSNECYWKDKPNKIKHGKESQFYNRIETQCTNCGKPISKIPFSFKQKNSFGDNHNFCCHQCYWNYRRKYYVGEKSVNWQKEFTEEQRKKMSYTAVMNARKTKTRDTKIQLCINEILDKNDIQYEREFFLGNYMQIDNYLSDYNLMIEIQGDYWHANPLLYNDHGRSINNIQSKDIIQDKKKHTMAKNNGIEILYLWENDILHNIELCEKLILLYIKSNGNISNYNSFNWMLDIDGAPILKNPIIYSYHELPYKECKKILKQKVG